MNLTPLKNIYKIDKEYKMEIKTEFTTEKKE